MNAVLNANELNGDANVVALAPNAVLEEVINAKFLADLADVLGGVLVHHGRGASDDTEMIAA